MRKTIFIRSYHRDLEWLKFCLRSIKKFVTGCDRVVVVVPHGDLPAFRAAGVDAVGTTESLGGYLQQQVDKIYADVYCGGDDTWIYFFDSDCVVTAPFDLKTLFNADGKPIILHTPYAVLGNAVPWQKPTEDALGFQCTEETMRRHPATYRGSELRAFREWFRHNRAQTIDDFARAVKGNAFSEFNVLGSWMWRFHHGTRDWLNTEHDPIDKLPLKQFWSWGGVTPEIRAEIEKILA